MMQPRLFQPAERMRHGVNGAQPLLKAEAALQRRHDHLRPRNEVAAIGKSLWQPAYRPSQPVEGDGIGRRVEARAQEGFDAMADRIHARRRRQQRRQAQR